MHKNSEKQRDIDMHWCLHVWVPLGVCEPGHVLCIRGGCQGILRLYIIPLEALRKLSDQNNIHVLSKYWFRKTLKVGLILKHSAVKTKRYLRQWLLFTISV